MLANLYTHGRGGRVWRSILGGAFGKMSNCSATGGSEGVSPISLKGTSKGFEILIASAASAEQIANDIEAKLDEAPGFFRGGDVTLRFDDAPPRGYLGPIEAVTGRFDLRIVGVHGPEAKRSAEQESVKQVLSELGLVEPVLASGTEPIRPADESSESLADKAEPKAAATQDGVLPPKMLVGPVRSGCILEVDGHLTVIGDVNPGAEIRATGSIVVLGRLRGIAHAGPAGFILALQLEPQQLRIGNLVARAGDAEQSPENAEIAFAKDSGIIVEKYKGRLPAGIATAKF